jgi:hypothetical protein
LKNKNHTFPSPADKQKRRQREKRAAGSVVSFWVRDSAPPFIWDSLDKQESVFDVGLKPRGANSEGANAYNREPF